MQILLHWAHIIFLLNQKFGWQQQTQTTWKRAFGEGPSTLNHFARTRTHDLPALGLLSYFVWNHNIGRLSADYHATWVRKSTEKYFVKSFLWWLQFVGTSFSRTFLANLSSPETVISQKLSRRLHTVWNLGNFCITWNLFREINYKVNSLLKKLFSRKFFKKSWYKNFVKSTVCTLWHWNLRSFSPHSPFLNKISWNQIFY